MTNPSPYVVSYSFSGFQASSPTTPLPAPALDNELADVAASVASIIAALATIRRADGALNNNIVTFDSFEEGLQLMIDPTNGQLVAAAVATAQAAAVSASGFNTSAAGHDTAAAASAVAAATSAGSVNFTLFLAKANNLAGLGSLETSRANLGLGNAAIATIGGGAGQVVALDGNAKLPAYDGSQLTNVDVLPVGTLLWSTSVFALPGTVKANGAVLSRTTFARLWAWANASGNIAPEAAWASGASGAFSFGDLSSNFRLPDLRAEFIRGLDDGRGIDVGRLNGHNQGDLLRDHTHVYTAATNGVTYAPNAGSSVGYAATPTNSSGASIGGNETRPRNVPMVGCIKY